jgi:hypothetical protein
MDDNIERLMIALIPLEAKQPWAVSRATGLIDIREIIKQAELDATAYYAAKE